MNFALIAVFIVILFCASYATWKVRGWIARFEEVERIVHRKELPNAVKAGLENVWALGDLARLINGKPNEQLIALAAIVRQQKIASDATNVVLEALLNDTAELRRDPKGYKPDKAMKDK